MLKIGICDADMEFCKNLRTRLEERYPGEINITLYQTLENLRSAYESGDGSETADILLMNLEADNIDSLDMEKLFDAIRDVKLQLQEKEKEYFVVSLKGNIFKVKLSDILYFESEKRTVILHTNQGKWTIYKKLDDVQSALPAFFLRCHQSYLVNMNEIKSMKALRLELNNGCLIPVSRPKYRETKERFLQFLENCPKIVSVANNRESEI